MQKDKVLHFSAGLIITALCSLFLPAAFAVGAGVLAGAAKEGYDSLGYGVVDVWDFIATVAGSMVAGGIVMLLKGGIA